MKLRNTASTKKRWVSTLVWGVGWLGGYFGIMEYFGIRGDAPWYSFSEWQWGNMDRLGWWWDVIAYGVPVWLIFHWRFRGHEFDWLRRFRS